MNLQQHLAALYHLVFKLLHEPVPLLGDARTCRFPANTHPVHRIEGG